MTKTKAIALFVAIVGSLLYFKLLFFSPEKSWETHQNAGLEAYWKKNYPEAEKELLAALNAAEHFPSNDPRLTSTLNSLIEVYQSQGKYSEAEPYLKRSLDLARQNYGSDSSVVAANLINLAGNYRLQGKYAKAEPLYKQALEIWEKVLGPENPLILFTLEGYVEVLHQMGRDAEARPYEARIKAGRAKQSNGDSG